MYGTAQIKDFLLWVIFHAAAYVLSDDGKLCSDLSDAEPVGIEDCKGLVAIAALKTIIPSLIGYDNVFNSNGYPKYCFFHENSNRLYWNNGFYWRPKNIYVGCGEGKLSDTDCRSGYRQICKTKKVIYSITRINI